MKIIIWVSIFLGYFILRFGMVSRGRSREIIQFSGGVILTISFILSFLLLGWKMGLFNILIFWIVITPITELIINKIQKKINLPYKDIHEYLAKKYNTTPEDVQKTIYKNLDNEL